MNDQPCKPDGPLPHSYRTATAARGDAVSPKQRTALLRYRQHHKVRRLHVALATLAWFAIVIAWLASEFKVLGGSVQKSMPSQPLGARSPGVFISLISRDGAFQFQYLNFRVVDRDWRSVPTTTEFWFSSSKLTNSGTQSQEDILASMRRPFVSFAGFLFSHSTRENMQSQDLQSPMFRSRYTVAIAVIPYYAPTLLLSLWTFVAWRRILTRHKKSADAGQDERSAAHC